MATSRRNRPHRLLRVEQRLVHVHIEEIRPAIHLVAGDPDRVLERSGADQAGEPLRAGHIGAFADHQKCRLRAHQRVGSGEPQPPPARRKRAGGGAPDPLPDGGDVGRGGAAAAADEVDEAGFRQPPERGRGVFRGLVIAPEFVGKAGVRHRPDRDRRLPRERLHEGTHHRGAEGAVDPAGGDARVLHGDPEGLGVLAREVASSPVHRGEGNQQPGVPGGFPHRFGGGVERGLGVQGVEAGLDQQDVGASGQQAPRLFEVGGAQFVPGDRPAGRVRDIRRDAERPVRRAHGAEDEPGPAAAVFGGGVRRDGAAGIFGSEAVQLERPVGQPVVGQRHRRSVEGVGGERVGAGVEVLPVDPFHQFRAGEREHIVEPLQRLRVVRESRAAKAGLVQPLRLQHGAHRAVEHQDPLPQGLGEGGAGRDGHRRRKA